MRLIQTLGKRGRFEIGSVDKVYQSHQRGLDQITSLRFIFDDMSEEKNLINQKKYMSAIPSKDQK
ncbi:MAG: hypothetical protein BBJ57_13925 [Desulfobacterales bacterium PC51MH44]|nr:MAG: hypothetical protein BBJ57_13925 [Desulfobacterales bacterium PC51MH44]